MEVKEAIQGKIDVLILLYSKGYLDNEDFMMLSEYMEELEIQLQQAKSIEDIVTPLIIENQGLKLYKDNEVDRLKKAFKAGRTYSGCEEWKYEEFEDYLKSKEYEK